MRKSNNREFSKTLLIQESILIWITTFAYVLLAFFCIKQGFTGTLPWLTAGVGLPWTAYGVSQAFYYNKSKNENTQGGIKYEMALKDFDYQIQSSLGDAAALDLDGPM